MRPRTSASDACGSTSLNLAVPMRGYIAAPRSPSRSPPRSEPANNHDFPLRAKGPAHALSATVGEADAPVVEEAGEAVLTPEHVVHRLCHRGVARQPGALGAHPRLELGHRRCAPLVAHSESPFGGFTVYLALDEQRIDAVFRSALRRGRRRKNMSGRHRRKLGPPIESQSKKVPTGPFCCMNAWD